VRIAVVHSFYSSGQPSGENTVVEDQVRALREAGHEVRLVARRTDHLEGTSFYSGRAALTVASGIGASPAQELADFAPDVVHLHNTFPNFGTSWLDDWGARTVVTLHNYRTVCAASTLFRDGAECHDCLHSPVRPALRHACYRGSRVATLPLALAARPGGALRRIGERCAEVLVLNEAAQQLLSQVFDRPVRLLPNFVGGGVRHETARSGWIYVGRLSPEKGITELLSNWPREESLDLVGAGPLEERVRELCARDRTRIRLLGLVERESLIAQLHKYEGLVLPSLWPEGLPTVVLEALACGVPIVASDRVAAHRSLSADGVASVLRTPFEEQGVRRALNDVRAQPSMRQRALQVHERRYSEAAWLATITPIYERTAASA
jgi:glycosyltransferase involved in cell wall biosynthesis